MADNEDSIPAMDLGDHMVVIERRFNCLLIAISREDFDFANDEHGLTDAELADAMLEVHEAMCESFGDYVIEAINTQLHHRKKTK